MQLSPLLQKVFIDFSVFSAILLALIFVLTFIFGRAYCSLICPLGVLEEVAGIIKHSVGFVFKKIRRDSKNESKAIKAPLADRLSQHNVVGKKANHPFKYFIAAVVFGVLSGGSAILLRYIEPYTYFGSVFSLSIIGMAALAVILLLVFFKDRLFCTNICPVGTLLGLISKVSLNKIYINKNACVSCGLCAKGSINDVFGGCPSHCIDYKEKIVDNETCIKCLKCLQSCPKGAIQFGNKQKEDVKFCPARRDFIIAGSVMALFAGMIRAGIVLKDNAVQKFKDIILPPGAKNQERFANKCYNCNLCVSSCPNGIITKADKEFPVVYIDYSKGKEFCKVDCNKCSKVCPTGAIEHITLEEKQKTRIAMAMIDSNQCTECGMCIQSCPYGAITEGKGADGAYKHVPVLNGAKCVGCGLCKSVCKFKAIEVFAVKEQKIL